MSEPSSLDCPETIAGMLRRLDERIGKLESGGVPLGRIAVDGSCFTAAVKQVAADTRRCAAAYRP